MRSPTSNPIARKDKINRVSPKDLRIFKKPKKVSDKVRAKEYYLKNKEKIINRALKYYYDHRKPTLTTIEKGLLRGNWAIDIHTSDNETAILEHRLRKLDRIVIKARIKSLSWIQSKTIDRVCIIARVKSLTWLKTKVAYRIAA